MPNMEVTQMATVLNSVLKQAQGQALTAVDTSDFISVATTALETGYDPFLQALNQVLSKTIFSVRPYTRKFKALQVDNITYGNHVRKVQIEDKDFVDDERFEPTSESTAYPQQKVSPPKVVQTNFYGQRIYQKENTLYKDQLDTAVTGPDEFARFITMQLTNISDMIEQAHESTARFTNANAMMGGHAVHLIAEYNTAKGANLVYDDIFKGEYFEDFIKFAYARIKTYSNWMTERTNKYHTNLTAHPRIMRHTPYQMQRLYVLSQYNELAETTVLSSVFHDEYLKRLNFELVNFWQSIDTPEKVKGKWTKLKADGTLEVSEQDTESAPIFAHLWDPEMMGYTVINTWSAPAPFNARYGFTTTYWHFTDRYWNDFTENNIVFFLD